MKIMYFFILIRQRNIMQNKIYSLERGLFID